MCQSVLINRAITKCQKDWSKKSKAYLKNNKMLKGPRVSSAGLGNEPKYPTVLGDEPKDPMGLGSILSQVRLKPKSFQHFVSFHYKPELFLIFGISFFDVLTLTLINYLRCVGVVVQVQAGCSVVVGTVDQISDGIRSLQNRSGTRIRIRTERIDDDLFRSFDFGPTKWATTSALGILRYNNVV